MHNIFIAALASASIAFSLAACGAPKRVGEPATESVPTSEVTGTDEQKATGIAFADLGITESDGVVVHPNTDGAAFDITIMCGGDAHFYQVSKADGTILQKESAPMDSFTIAGFEDEELVQAADDTKDATNYKAMYDVDEGWGWQVTAVGGGELQNLYVNATTGAITLIETVAE